jgi:RNA polymerase sigma-70 factor, ECF subfamily
LAAEDKILTDQIKRGEVKAFEKIFEAYYGSLCLFARKIVGDMDHARDIVQDVFVSVHVNHKTLDINTSLKSYLFKCVYNGCLNKIKQQKIYAGHHEYLLQNSPSSDFHDLMVEAELQERIRVTVDNLPEQCGKIFRMNRYEGRKNKEIAEELGISIRTVETQISKALTALRTNLAEFLAVLLFFLLL